MRKIWERSERFWFLPFSRVELWVSGRFVKKQRSLALVSRSRHDHYFYGRCRREANRVVRRPSCTLVRYYVAKNSVPAAEAWARSRGATDADIQIARRCVA